MRAVIWGGKLLYNWLIMVHKTMNFQAPQEAGKFITSWTVVSLCNRTMFHEVTN